MQNKLALLLLRSIDFSLSVLSRVKRPFEKKPVLLESHSAKKILVCNIAHMGDMVLSTAFISELKEQFPNCTIGVLLGSWSSPVIQGLPGIEAVHIVDHWKLNRSALSRLQKVALYLNQRKKVIKEIREQRYDIAIDLYSYFPNAIPILWKARIPLRAGYSSGGFGPMLTHLLEWKDVKQSMIQDYLNLLPLIGGRISKGKTPQLSEPSVAPITNRKYCVFHIGAGLSLKEWPEAHWKIVLKHFVQNGYAVYFTGKGNEQKETIERIREGCESSFNMSDALDWSHFVALIRHAQLLISVDSVSGHIASAFDVPTVSLFTGMNCPTKWKPANPKGIVLSHPMPCAPCFKKQGCESMDCIRQINPKDVIKTAEELLAASSVH